VNVPISSPTDTADRTPQLGGPCRVAETFAARNNPGMHRRRQVPLAASLLAAGLLLSACGAPDRMASAPDVSITAEETETPEASPTEDDAVEDDATEDDAPEDENSDDDVSEEPALASPGKRFIHGPRTFEVRNITPVAMQVKITQVDNFDWGQEREPDGRPDHVFPLGVQGYVLEPMESVAVALYPNPNASSSPFKVTLSPVGDPSTTVYSDRFTSVRCTKGIDTDPTCYWKPLGGNSNFRSTLGDGTTVSGRATTTNFSTDMLTRLVVRADGVSIGESRTSDDVADPERKPNREGLGAARGMHPTVITNDSNMTLTFKVTGVDPEGHQAGRPRPDDPYPTGFDGMVLAPGESGGMAIWPDLTNWMFGGDGSRADFTISAYNEGSLVFSARIWALTSGENPLVGGFEWGMNGSSFMDRRYVTFTDSNGKPQRAFLWSIEGGKAGSCDGVHWCMRRELQIQPRS
jgi:hypothetical protein